MSKKGDFMTTQELKAEELYCRTPLSLTLSAHVTAHKDWPSIISIDCNGAGRNLVMPAEEDVEGKIWLINNRTGATHALTVQNDAAGTIQSIAATKSAIIAVVAGTWRVFSVVA
jgi:hypothetical protein